MRLPIRRVRPDGRMRQHYYNFAHKVLPSDVTTQPTLWGLISGDKAHSYLQMRWSDAAPAGAEQPAKGLMWIEPVHAFGVEIRVVRMPPPEDVSEAYYGAIAKSEDGAIRYFVCEKGGQSVYWAEWRKNMRIRGEEVQENAPRDVGEVFTEAPSNAAPWEISSSSIPGLPYLASFLMAVCQEMTNKEANAMAKKELAAGPDLPVHSAPGRGASNSQPKVGLILAAIVAGTIALIILVNLLV
jgi:hypothetical protein